MRSFVRILAGSLITLVSLLSALIGFRTISSHAQASLVNNFSSHYFAPYVDITAWPTPSLVQDTQNGGIKYYSLAFITNNAPLSCLAAWGGVVPLSQLSTYLPQVDSDIQHVCNQGGDVIVSFWWRGWNRAGPELHQCQCSASTVSVHHYVLQCFSYRL